VLHRGIVSLTAATTDWVDKRAARRAQKTSATRVSWPGAITEELTCSSVQEGGAACARWRQGLGYPEQFVGVADRMRTHKLRRWNAECRRSGVVRATVRGRERVLCR
jgi:hypothetical protein